MRRVVAAGGALIFLFIVFGGIVAARTDVSDRNTDVRIRRTDDGTRYFAHPDLQLSMCPFRPDRGCEGAV